VRDLFSVISLIITSVTIHYVINAALMQSWRSKRERKAKLRPIQGALYTCFTVLPALSSNSVTAVDGAPDDMFGVPIEPNSEGPAILGKFIRFLLGKGSYYYYYYYNNPFVSRRPDNIRQHCM
jgi:hypothetical protein